MFVITNRDLQVRLKNIRERVSEGEEAILHSKGTEENLIIITLKQYNEMLKRLKKIED